MRSRIQILLPLLTILLLRISSHAQITLPKVFGDSMVLQRSIKIPVWGNSTPSALIIAKLGDVQGNEIRRAQESILGITEKVLIQELSFFGGA